MPGLATNVRNGIVNRIVRGTAYTIPQATQVALVTSVTAGMAGGGAVANEASLTGYSRVTLSGTTFDVAAGGESDNGSLLDFGTVDAAQTPATQTYTHAVFLDAGGNVVAIGQIVDTLGAADPLLVDTATTNRRITVPIGRIALAVTFPADAA